MTSHLRRQVETAISRRHGNPLAALAAKIARWYVRSYENFDYNLDTNGERWLLEQVARPGAVLFDVGANVGDWTIAALGIAPQAEIHAFEIVPETAAELQSRVPGSVVVNAIGLLDRDGSVEIRHLPSFSAGSGMYSTIHEAEVVFMNCRVTTGDSYCARARVEHLDLLKVDAEGSEHLILAGFQGMLGAGIDVIQFEYGLASIASRFLLADLYDLLCPWYEVGKLYPTGVDFRPYQLRDEDFLGPNFVAVRRDLRSVMARLAGSFAGSETRSGRASIFGRRARFPRHQRRPAFTRKPIMVGERQCR